MISKRFAFVLVMLVPVLALCQGSSVGSSELKLPLNARSAALGEATVADAGQFTSWRLNPANLFTDGPFTVALTHSQWIQDVQTDFLGVQIPFSIGTAGFGISTNSVPGIEIRETPGPSLGTFSARFVCLQAGLATRFLDDFVAGISAKYLYEKLYVDEATGYGLDLGMLYHTPIQGLQAGVSLTDLGSMQAFRIKRSNLPTFAKVGAAYNFRVEEFSFSASAASAAGLQYSEHHFMGSFETVYNKFVSVRFGYETGYDSRGLTAGLGLRYEFLQLDYAYVPFSLGLGDGHLFSIGFQL